MSSEEGGVGGVDANRLVADPPRIVTAGDNADLSCGLNRHLLADGPRRPVRFSIRAGASEPGPKQETPAMRSRGFQRNGRTLP
jgi:hypothetical protein